MKTSNSWCPLNNTTYEGFCVDNTAVIEVQTANCDHKEYCLKIKEEMDKNQDENQPTN
jgi:hypothetical protein